MRDTARSGLGELTIINDNSKQDALAMLTNLEEDPFIAVFIRAGESFNITGLEDNTYDMYFKLGNKWNDSQFKFLENERRYKLDRSLLFETSETSDRITCTTWTVALEEAAPNANEAAGKIPLSEEEFPT